MAAFAPQERAYYDRLFSVIDKDQSGVLPGQDALPFLVSSNLPQQTLGEVWAVADPENNGFLTRDGWYKAARLIGWMQKGGQAQVDETLTSRAGPYPTFAGQAPPPQQQPLSAQVTGQPQRASTLGAGLPPLTAADRAKFTKIFVGCGPQNGLVSGDKARDVFLKSQLGYDKLGQIWMLADTQQRGSLDLPDFIIGMYLIQSCMANSALSLPATLPPTVYEQASGGRAPPTSPIARQNTGPASPIRPQYTGQLQPQSTGQNIAAQATGRSAFAPPPPPAANAQWDITPDAKATSDRFFAQLDPQNRGVIDGDVAVPFMLQSQLDETALASIWDLADIRREGKLTKDEFAVAMYLINGKLAGKDVPAVLPNSLIPPSLRGEYGGQQQEAPSGPSSITKDLFDLFADDPPSEPTPAPSAASPSRGAAPQPQPFSAAAFLPQPPSRKGTAPPPPASRALSPSATGGSMNAYPSSFAAPARMPSSDLLGDDSGPVETLGPDRSAEIGNKQNQLSSTERSNADLAKQRAELEKSAESSSAQLADIESRLSSARVKHEAETKSVSDLRTRVSEQQSKIKTLNNDLISAESDVSALKSEKDELEQTLLRDKEEVRGLQRRMKEVDDDKTGLKLLLEKLKKDSRQQKGMVTIAKKQLTTAESSRDGVQHDIKAEEASQAAAASAAASPPVPAVSIAREASPFAPSPAIAAGIPLPATPQALSPVATGMSQRSNNPFDRLRTAQSPPPPAPRSPQEQGSGTSALLGVGAVVGATAGVVAAGASTLFEAAKHAVSPSEEPSSVLPDMGSEPVETGADTTSRALPSAGEVQSAQSVQTDVASPTQEEDPFRAADGSERAEQVEMDPFGAPSRSATAAGAVPPSVDEFESSFGDSFSAPQAKGFGESTSGNGNFDSDFGSTSFAPDPAANQTPAFDSDFDSFDGPGPTVSTSGPTSTSAPGAAPGSDFDSAFADFSEEGLPAGISKSAVPYIRPEAERTASTQAVAAESRPESPGAPPASSRSLDDGSSDEDEGPEDLDQPNKIYNARSGSSDRTPRPEAAGFDFDAEGDHAQPAARAPSPPQPVESPSTGDLQSKSRRSAPPPPARSQTAVLAPPIPIDDFDPFGTGASTSAPVQAAPRSFSPQSFTQLPPGAAPSVPSHAAASGNAFDEDDFDFSDLPPAKVEQHSQQQQQHDFGHSMPALASKDDFDFDDDFDKPSTGQGSEGSNSNGMSKSYEMVSPAPAQAASGQNDPWGSQPFGASAAAPSAQGSGLSFDDAFGGDFEPAPAPHAQPQPTQTQQQYSAPSGAPPGKSDTLSAPPLPQRRDSEAQPDDIEDVKKLCQMGFPRSLVVEALAANSYDFQKTLNVLLQ